MSNKSGNATGNSTVMLKIASFIVDKRMLFFLIYACLVIFSFFSSNWTSVESDLKEYLEEDTETKQGIDLMKKQFFTFGSAKVMVANITYQDAQDLKKKMEDLSYVQSVTFCDDDADDADDPEFDSYDDLKKHYNNNSALYTVNFIYDENDDRALTALSDLETEIAGYKPYVTTDMGNQKMDVINQETATALIMVAFVVVGVLLLTCKSYGEIPILLITFGTAMLINNGTNFLFGKISFIANSVSSILQLA
ncbi:MAG: RND transporter, partial [Lachnospiraceae bacterium]|nr:RND transporter [Lachnospiraceae bacterium]